jgi:hypothetical protein
MMTLDVEQPWAIPMAVSDEGNRWILKAPHGRKKKDKVSGAQRLFRDEAGRATGWAQTQ